MRLPGPLRAAVGLVASVADEAKHLPDRAIELPMLAVSTALQVSLRAQQRYASLAARGEAVLNRQPVSEDPPPWATFDDPVSIEELRRSTRNDADGLGAESSRLLEDIFGVADPADSTTADSTAADSTAADSTTAESRAPARKTPAKKTTPAAAKKATPPTRRASPTKKSPNSPAASSDQASSDTESPDPAASGTGKAVSKPRHTAPSAFDNASDDD